MISKLKPATWYTEHYNKGWVIHSFIAMLYSELFCLSLCCWMTPDLRKDIQCHEWPHFSVLTNHPIRHQARSKSGLSAWWLKVAIYSSSGICVGMHMLTCSLYHPKGKSGSVRSWLEQIKRKKRRERRKTYFFINHISLWQKALQRFYCICEKLSTNNCSVNNRATVLYLKTASVTYHNSTYKHT